MPAGSTYSTIATTTLGSNQGSVVFSSISSAYTDLVLVVSARDTRVANGDGIGITFNTDTSTGSTNYSDTYLAGDGTSASSGRDTSARNISGFQIAAANYGSNDFGMIIINIMNYANTTTNKTILARGGWAPNYLAAVAGLWRNTAAINTITLYPGFNGSGYNFVSGSTFSLYGITAA